MSAIATILEEGQQEIYFQPIVCFKDERVIAYEALLRQFDAQGKQLSTPWVFEEARNSGMVQELDRKTQIKAIEKFAKYYKTHPNCLLFLNIEPETVESFKDASNDILSQTLDAMEIPYANVVLEMKEDAISSTQALQTFCNYYHALGFNIALDDFGTGSSSFDRLSLIPVDIVKIDRSLVDGCNENYINSEIIKAITNICTKIGAIALAEGVEQQEEMINCMQAGINMFQGYWLSRPLSKLEPIAVSKRLQHLKTGLNRKQLFEKRQYERMFDVADSISQEMQRMWNSSAYIEALLAQYEIIEAVYLIDAHTYKQIGDTIMHVTPKRFYNPSGDGDDHAYKEYIYGLVQTKRDAFMTTHYISRASGNMCHTFSKEAIINGKEVILCIDIQPDCEVLECA